MPRRPSPPDLPGVPHRRPAIDACRGATPAVTYWSLRPDGDGLQIPGCGIEVHGHVYSRQRGGEEGLSWSRRDAQTPDRRPSGGRAIEPAMREAGLS